MKSIILTSIFFLVQFCSYSADTLNTNITKATVFLSGAQVFRQSKTVSIKKGVNEVIIKDVSPYLNQKQLQATAKGSFLILDVQFQTEYVTPPAVKATIIPAKIQKEINILNDTLLFIGFEKERIQSKLNNLNEEKKMVMQNQLMKGGGISDTLPEFKEIVKYYRLKLDDINELLLSWKKKQYYSSAREKKHRARLNELNNYSSNIKQPTVAPTTRYHIMVTTYSDVKTTGKIEVNYLVTNAGWIPAYDLRADNTRDPMTITYKAHVFQNSGEDWSNVKLILSTYNQNCFTTKPTTGIWRLDYTINKPQPVAGTVVGANEVQFHSQNFASEVKMKEFQQNNANNVNSGYKTKNTQFIALQSMAAINQNFSNVEFEIKLPYSIKADGSQKLMVVTNEKVDAEFYHYILPRANKNAFLLAKIGEWENLSLLPGIANIYFNQTIVGNTSLNPSIMTDTMEVTLGRDQGIVSERKKVSEKLKKGLLSKRQVKTLTFELVIRNNTKSEINLELEDQVPVTSNEEIKIEIVDKNGADFNKVTGKLTWDLILKPGEKKTITFSYSVEHDEDKPIS